MKRMINVKNILPCWVNRRSMFCLKCGIENEWLLKRMNYFTINDKNTKLVSANFKIK